MEGERDKQSSAHQRLQEYSRWKARYEADKRDPREQFEKISHIAVYMSYDLIDKLRWFEKDTLNQSDEEIAKRLPHMTAFLDKLRSAYLHFAETDF